MKYIKLFLSAILILTIILSFPGCTNKDTEDIEYTYKENKIELPSEYTRVIDMCVQQSGELRIAVSNSNNSKISIFDSSDNGNSWNMICNVSDLLDLPESSITNIIISDNNSFFCENCLNVKNNEDIFTGEKKYYYFNNGDYTNVDIKLDNISFDDFVNVYGKIVSDSNVEIVNGVASGSFSDDGNLFISDYLGKGYLFDSTSWEKISEYKINEKMNQVEDICHYDDYTIAVSYEGSLFYDYLKGNVSEESNLEDNITNVISDAQNTTTNSGNFLCVKGDALYFFNACGLYEYSNNEWNQISERTGPFGNDSEKTVTSFAISDENKYYICVTDTSNNNSEIYNYEKTRSEKSKVDLTIWSLKYSSAVENAINAYKSSNNTITVNYEIGVGEDGSTTVSDAINNLNTKILANDGPDVIMLDQLSIDNYINNGYLLDISDLINEYTENDVIFKNFANTYKKEDKIYAIPSRFSIMTIEGNKNTVAKASDISSLMSYAEQLKSDNSNTSVFEEKNFEYVAEYMYNAEIPSLISNGEIDTEAVKNFCSDLQKLHKIYGNPNVSFEESLDNVYIGVNYYGIFENTLQIATDYISSFGYQFSGINALKKYDNEFEYGLVNSSVGNIYLPMNIAGINSSSNNIKTAKEFIGTLLSENVQTLSENDGAEPINKNAFLSDLNGDYNIDMEDFDNLKLKSLTDEEKSGLVSLVESLDTPVNRDITIRNTVLKQLESCFNGSISLEEAEKNVINKLQLYMKE